MVHTNFKADSIAAQVDVLSGFSPSLGALLATVCAEFGEIQADVVSQSEQLYHTKESILQHGIGLSAATEQIAELRDSLKSISHDSQAGAIKDVKIFVRTFSDQLQMVHDQLSMVRAATKNDLLSTQGHVEKLFNDALTRMSGLVEEATAKSMAGNGKFSLGKNADLSRLFYPNGDNTEHHTVDHLLQVLADRVISLEKRVVIKEIGAGNVGDSVELSVHDRFDLLTTHLAQQEAQIHAQHQREREHLMNMKRLMINQRAMENAIRTMATGVGGLDPIDFKLESLRFDHAGMELDDAELKSAPPVQERGPKYLGVGAEPVTQAMISSLESKLQSEINPAVNRLQQENIMLLAKISELATKLSDMEVAMREMDEEVKKAAEPKRGNRSDYEDDFFDSLASVKHHWSSIFQEIDQKLNEVENDPASNDMDEQSKVIVENLTSFRNLLARSLYAFEPQSSVQSTMDILYPKLDEINTEANRLFNLDGLGDEDAEGDETNGASSGISNGVQLSAGRGPSFLKSQVSGGGALASAASLKPFSSSLGPTVTPAGTPAGTSAVALLGNIVPSESPMTLTNIAEGDEQAGSDGSDSESANRHSKKHSSPITSGSSNQSINNNSSNKASFLRAQRFSKRKSAPVRPRLSVLAERGLGTDSGGRRSASTALRRADSILYGNTMGEFSHSLAEACLSSAPILGERIDKGVLKRRIDKLEEQLEDVALLSELGDEVAFIMEQVAKKVDKKDFKEMKKKKAGLSDLQMLRDQFFENIESLRVELNNKSSMELNANSLNGLAELLASGNIDGAALADLLSGAAGKGRAANNSTSDSGGEIVKRFDLLYRQFQDLLNHCAGFVHREEVESALKVLLTEVKTLKSSLPAYEHLRKQIKKKADGTDVQKLITILAGALDESAMKTAGGSSLAGQALAIHSKCLACDKPLVNPMLQSLQSFGQEQMEKYNHRSGASQKSSAGHASSTGAAPRSAHGRRRDKHSGDDGEGGKHGDESDVHNDINLGHHDHHHRDAAVVRDDPDASDHDLIGHAALSDGEANIDEPNDNNHSRSIRSHNNPRDRSLNGRSDEQKLSGSAGFSDNDSTEGSALAMLSSSGHSRPGGGTGPSSLGQKYGNHISADSLQPSMEAPFSDAVQNASNIHSSSGVIQAHVQVRPSSTGNHRLHRDAAPASSASLSASVSSGHLMPSIGQNVSASSSRAKGSSSSSSGGGASARTEEVVGGVPHGSHGYGNTSNGHGASSNSTSGGGKDAESGELQFPPLAQKSRVRASVGGGLGPSYAMDTR